MEVDPGTDKSLTWHRNANKQAGTPYKAHPRLPIPNGRLAHCTALSMPNNRTEGRAARPLSTTNIGGRTAITSNKSATKKTRSRRRLARLCNNIKRTTRIPTCALKSSSINGHRNEAGRGHLRLNPRLTISKPHRGPPIISLRRVKFIALASLGRGQFRG